MNYTECIENARPRLGKYCKACPNATAAHAKPDARSRLKGHR